MTFSIQGILVDSRWLDKTVAASVAASLINKYKLHAVRTPDPHSKLDSVAITLASRGVMPKLDLTHVKRFEYMQALMQARTGVVGPVRGGGHVA